MVVVINNNKYINWYFRAYCSNEHEHHADTITTSNTSTFAPFARNGTAIGGEKCLKKRRTGNIRSWKACASQNMRCVPTRLHMAEKMGACVGRGKHVLKAV